MDDVRAHRHVHGGGPPGPPRRGQQAHLQVLRIPSREVAAHCGAEAQAVAVALHDGAVDLLARLPRHPELPRAQAALHVLGRVAGHGQLEVVDDPGAVHGQARDQALLHEVDEDRRQAHLQDVRADPPQDRFAAIARPQDLGGQPPQDIRPQDARERVEERAERAAARVGAGELVQRDLALAAGQGVGTDALQVERGRSRCPSRTAFRARRAGRARRPAPRA